MILKEITANKRGLENIQNPPSLPMEGNVNSEGRRGVQKVAISEGWRHVGECPSDMAAGNQQKHLLPSFASKAWAHPSRRTHKLFLKQGQFRICSKSPNRSLAHHVHMPCHAPGLKFKRILSQNEEPFRSENLKKNYVFSCSNTSWN